MKTKRKINLTIILGFLVLLLATYSCTDENNINKENKLDDYPVYSEYSYDNINFKNTNLSKIQDNKDFQELINSFDLKNSFVGKDSEIIKNSTTNFYGFTIDSTNIKEIVKENYLAYTFKIHRIENKVGYIENLLVERKNGVEKAYIISYIPDKNWLINHLNDIDTPFFGKVKIVEIQKNSSNSDTNQTNSKSMSGCMEVTIYIEISCPCEGHWPGQRCICNQQPSRETYKFTVCDNGSGDYAAEGYIGSGSGGGGSDSSSGPIGDNSLTSFIGADNTNVNTTDALISLLNLNSEESISIWLSHNTDFSDIVYNFVENHQYSQEALSFGKNAIVSMMNSINVDFNQFYITQFINSIENPITGSSIEFFLIAQYKSSMLLDLSLYSISSNEIQVGEYFLKPHYGLGNKLVFYSAYRVNNIGVSTLGVEYIIKADALQDFQNRINFYTYAANLFYVGGIPSQEQIAMAAGNTWKGLGSMWNNALHSEEWWAYVILSFGHAIVNLPVNSTISSTQTSSNWKVSLNKMTSEAFQGKVVTNPQGVSVTIDIPKNYVPSIAENGQGINFSPNPPVGTHIDAGVIRVMQPTQSGVTYPHPKGYVKFYNNLGQPINPINGQPLGNDFNHFDFP